MTLYVVSNRNIHASPHYAHIYALEDILRDSCNAKIVSPRARALTKSVQTSSLNPAVKSYLRRAIRKSVGLLEPVSEVPEFTAGDTNVLFVIAMNGADLITLTSLKDWRSKFDLVVSFVYDAWLLKSFPDFTNQLDHLFVPVADLVEPLSKLFGISVSHWPHGADVLARGSKNIVRPIDIASYGRVPSEYHSRLIELSEQGDRFFYYRQVPETSILYPDQPYTLRRLDHQHRTLLSNILSHSKSTLAFDFTYTTKGVVELPNHRRHPSYSYRKPVLALRWLEGLAAGAAIVGKRPPSPEADELLNWTDATIELPDDVDRGVDALLRLVRDDERVMAINRRNYWNTLARHDHRWRLAAAFERLQLPTPRRLHLQLSHIRDMCSQSDAATWIVPAPT